MSLVENLARRQQSPLELVHAIGALAGRGYSHAEIAKKVDFSVEYVAAICVLLERGEEKLISAVERGVVPHSIAMEIARAKEGEVQQALAQAYEERKIPGNQVLAIRQIIEQRNNSGKQLHARGRASGTAANGDIGKSDPRLSARDGTAKLLVKRASLARSRLLFVANAMRRLLADEHFVALLRAEGLQHFASPSG